MARVLVTGGAGFIGSHLVDRLLANGHLVYVWDNFSTGNENNLKIHENLTVSRYVDITDPTSIINRISKSRGFDYVFHLAAQINLRDSFDDPVFDADVNINGTLLLLRELKRKCPDYKFIFASTGGAIYDPNEPLPWSEKSKTIPKSPYGLSKLTAEQYIRMFCDNHLILRLSNVYGPRQNHHGEAGVVSIFLDKMLNNKPITIFGDGTQTRDFVYVDDVVDAFMMAITEDITGTFNVSSGNRVDVNQIVTLLRKFVKSDLDVKFTPPIEGELMHSGLDHHKISATYGWRPKTGIFDGIKKTVEY